MNDPVTDPSTDRSTVGTDLDFDSWVAARGPALMRLGFVLTGNRADAEDVVQDALSRALVRWSRISGVADPDAYVRRMVVNAHVSWWRKFRRRETPVATVRDSPHVGAAIDRVAPEERDRLWQACVSLPRDQRTAVVLRFYEDLEYAEIADLTGVREGSVRSRVSRGIATLRQQLADESAQESGQQSGQQSGPESGQESGQQSGDEWGADDE